jgi:hypothetical protein
MNWLRLEKALGAWSAWYRPRLGRAVAKEPGAEFHPEEQTLYEALDCKVEDLKLAERVDALERLHVAVKEWADAEPDSDAAMRATDAMIDISDELEELEGH